jgi:hypothetical protein
MSMDIIGHRLGDVMVNENDKIIAMFFGPHFTIPSPSFYLMELTNGTTSKEATRFYHSNFTQASLLKKTKYSDHTIVLLQLFT